MPLGYLTIVLHAHLPFVRHPEHDDVLEEDWLFEAIVETYLPLLDALTRLDRAGVPWKLTLSVSPTLAAMLGDPLLQYRCVRYIDQHIALSMQELDRTRWQPEFHRLAEFYLSRFRRCREQYVQLYQHDLISAFGGFAARGNLELITTSATHGYLPLFQSPEAVRAQVKLGVREFERHFGRKPRGFWLPECGYVPGLEKLLADEGVDYFFMETHGLLYAEPRPRYGIYAPVACPDGRVAALSRDTEATRQVWSALEGYPGDYWYRDFYRDIGFDLDMDYLRPFLHSVGVRHFTGLKYHRVTGHTTDGRLLPKQYYDPQMAAMRAGEHASNFLFNRVKQLEWLSGAMNGRPAILVAPYDAELFGHWWFEGPQWLESLLRQMVNERETLEPITVSEYLERHPHIQEVQPATSSWGEGGYHGMWLNDATDWIYPHLHEAAERMVALANQYAAEDALPVAPHDRELAVRALNQAARELMLAQSSDWAFIIKMGTTADYAAKRTRAHLGNFLQLEEPLRLGDFDLLNRSDLLEMERRNNLFPLMDYRLYCGGRESAPSPATG